MLAEALGDPSLRAASSGCPAEEVHVDATGPRGGRDRGAPAGRATPVRRGDAAARHRRARHGARRAARPAGERDRGRRAGDRDRPPAASRCAASSPRSRSRGRASSPPATRSGGGSSATSTTGPSSGWSRSASRSATSRDELAGGEPDGAARWTPRSPSWPRAIEELRELARGVRPAGLDDGLARALRELASRSPLRTERRGDRGALRGPARDRRLLRRQRGAHQRGQARAGVAGRPSRAARGNGSLVRLGRRRRRRRRGPVRRARAWPASPTASPRSAGSLTVEQPARAAGTVVTAELPCES